MKPLRPLPLLLLLLAACGLDESYDPNAELPSCADSACSDELDELAQQISQVDSIEAVRQVRYFEGKELSGLQVTGAFEIESTDRADCSALVEEIGPLVWHSKVAPIDGYRFDCYPKGATDSSYGYVADSWVGNTAEDYRKAWGERG